MSVVDFPTRGRGAKPLPSYTFKDSGITVQIRKLGPSTIQDISRAVTNAWRNSSDPDKREPKPPVVDTELGPETNEADEGYQRRRIAWANRINQEASERLLDFAALEAVECDVDADAVRRLKASYAAMGFPIEKPEHMSEEQHDKLLYVTRICIASPEDMTEFSNYVTRRSQPTEEQVHEQIESFQGDVSGA